MSSTDTAVTTMDSTSKTDGIQTRSMAKQTDNVGQQVDPVNNESQTSILPAESTDNANVLSSEGQGTVSPKINQGVENNSNQSNKAQAAAVNIDRQSISSKKSKNLSTKGLEALSNLVKIKAKYEFDKKIKELELKRKLEEAEYNKQKIICEIQLELLRGEQELAIAEASASVYSDHNSIIDNESLIQVHDDDNIHSNTQNWIDNLPEINNDGVAEPPVITDEPPQLSQNLTGLDPMSKPFVPVSNSANLVPVQQLSQQDINERLVASLCKQALPKCEPDIFNGDSALFVPWKQSFKTLISEASCTPEQEINYMLKYTFGKPKDLVNTFRKRVHNDPAVKLESLWECMKERFGHNSKVVGTLLEGLVKASHFRPDDRDALQRFYDKCEDIASQIPFLKGLEVLNSSYFMKSMVLNMPKPIRTKWEHKLIKYLNCNPFEDYPPFTKFVEVMKEISLLQNHPALVPNDTLANRSTSLYQNRPSSKSLRTDIKPSPQKPTPTLSKPVNKCILHPDSEKEPHTLSECRYFRSKSYYEKSNIVKKAGLCFQCLSEGHQTSQCSAVIRCSKCGGRHRTVMHNYREERKDVSETKPPLKQSGESVGDTKEGGETTATVDTPVSTSCTQICGGESFGRSCGKIVLADIYHKDDPSLVLRTYVTLDDQSNHTLGTSELFDRLQASGESYQYTLETCHGKDTCFGRRANGLVIKSLNGGVFNLPTVIETDNIPGDKNEIPSPALIEKFPHLKEITNHVPEIDLSAPISLLIGRDGNDLLKVRKSINGPVGAPWAQLLDLGWTVSGNVCLERQGGNIHIKACKTAVGVQHVIELCANELVLKDQITPLNMRRSNPEITKNLSRDEFFMTASDKEFGLSQEDLKFWDIMENGFHKNALGNWEAPLPLKHNDVILPNNRQQAEKRLNSLTRRFERDRQMKDDYLQFMEKILHKGHASPVPEAELQTTRGKVFYLPHFGVYHPRKKSQIRVVFDSAAEYAGTSLNAQLYQGPNLINNLHGRLIRFRQYEVGIMCDVEQMFHSFHVNPEHRDFMRFLWFKENNPALPIIEYRMNVHIFGNTSSPTVASYGLKLSAKLGREKYGVEAFKFVNEDFYVDDGIYSSKTPEKAIQLISSAQSMLAEHKLRLHKVVSNVHAVIKAFPQEDRASNVKDLNFTKDKLPAQTSLGVYWNLEEDVFSFKVLDADRPYTKRGVLSTIHSIFDPLGFLAPYIIVGRNFLHKLIHSHKDNGVCLDWDDPLTDDYYKQWSTWTNDFDNLNKIAVSRCFTPPDFGIPVDIELHGFADASCDAIGSVVYLRLKNANGDVHLSLVKGAAKVRPQRQITIPRMELCASVMLVNMVKDIKKHLELEVSRTTYYSDSKVVLGYISNDARRFYQFVANRVEVIRSLTNTSDWRYVESNENPADIATRGSTIANLLKCQWFSGPKFLIEPDQTSHEFPLIEEDVEIRPEARVRKIDIQHEVTTKCRWCNYFKHFESWYKLLRAITLLRLSTTWFQQHHKFEVTPQLMRESEVFILKHLQIHEYTKEIATLKEKQITGKRQLRGLSLHQLDPFIHTDGLLRVGGRLRNGPFEFPEKHPVIVPKRYHVTTLIIRHYHEMVQHQGRLITHGKVRQMGFWIIAGSQLVRNYIHNCLRCNFLRRPTETPKMADLPADRLSSSPPFTNVGLDAFGPWEVVTRKTRGGAASSKRWLIIFTCMSSRAVHIEVVDSMSTSAFICALRRFLAIRGPVAVLRSDQGTNFVGAKAELAECLKEIKDGEVKKFFFENQIEWKMNPPHASHFGGSWERQIGSIRRVFEGMLACLGKVQLTHDLLVTLMTEAAAIINSRPITGIPNDPSEPLPLSPSSILTMKTRPYLPAPGEFVKPDLYCQREWRRTQYLLDQFWTRWRREFVQEQQYRRKWTKDIPNLQVDDIVLIADKACVRGLWPRGRVVSVNTSTDGVVREAIIQVYEDKNPVKPTLNGVRKLFTRPACELVFLLRP